VVRENDELRIIFNLKDRFVEMRINRAWLTRVSTIPLVSVREASVDIVREVAEKMSSSIDDEIKFGCGQI
jgi:hypothetical protein